MGIEIERKFLVDRSKWKFSGAGTRIIQGYLCLARERPSVCGSSARRRGSRSKDRLREFRELNTNTLFLPKTRERCWRAFASGPLSIKRAFSRTSRAGLGKSTYFTAQTRASSSPRSSSTTSMRESSSRPGQGRKFRPTTAIRIQPGEKPMAGVERMTMGIDVSKYAGIVILIGAGISAASGIRTYRGPDGLWTQSRKPRGGERRFQGGVSGQGGRDGAAHFRGVASAQPIVPPPLFQPRFDEIQAKLMLCLASSAHGYGIPEFEMYGSVPMDRANPLNRPLEPQ